MSAWEAIVFPNAEKSSETLTKIDVFGIRRDTRLVHRASEKKNMRKYCNHNFSQRFFFSLARRTKLGKRDCSYKLWRHWLTCLICFLNVNKKFRVGEIITSPPGRFPLQVWEGRERKSALGTRLETEI